MGIQEDLNIFIIYSHNDYNIKRHTIKEKKGGKECINILHIAAKHSKKHQRRSYKCQVTSPRHATAELSPRVIIILAELSPRVFIKLAELSPHSFIS